MTEDEARATAAKIAGAAMPQIERYATLLIAENARQNLIARSTETGIWTRHLLDSLQLARFARDEDHSWLDVGSGAGLPGLVLATLDRWQMTLVEPRRRRAEFLIFAVEKLGLRNVDVAATDVRAIDRRHDLVSARAVAPVEQVFDLTRSCSGESTRYILPKGRSACADMDLARARWQGLFHVEQSLTDPDAGIVIADRVRAR